MISEPVLKSLILLTCLTCSMIDIATFRKWMGDRAKALSDEEVNALIALLYHLAEIELDHYQQLMIEQNQIEASENNSSPPKTIMNVALYTRHKSPKTSKLQLQELKKYCEFENYSVVGHYHDDQSAKDFNRPGFQQFITDLSNQTISAKKLICIDMNTFSRNIPECIDMLENFKSWDIELEVMAKESFWTLFHLIESIEERNRHSQRIKMGIKNAALRRKNPATSDKDQVS